MASRQTAGVRSGWYTLGGAVATTLIITVRSVIVARLLVPQEVGRFALAATAITTLDATSEPGLLSALVRAKSVDVRTCQTAWTALVVRGLVLSGLALAGAPAIAAILEAPDIVDLLRVLALIPAVRALAGLGPWLRVREVDLGPQVRIELSSVAVETAAAVVLAAMTHSAWALVVASLVGSLTTVVASYLVRGFRPGFCLDGDALRPLFAFGRWVFMANLLNFVSVNGDDLLVGRFAGTRSLGLYRMAYRLANVPTTEVSHVIARVAFPALSKAEREAGNRIGELFRRVLMLTTGVAAPLSVLLGVLAWDLVPALLGPQWREASLPLAIMAGAGFLRAVAASGGPLFLAVDKAYWDTAMQAVRSVVLLVGVVILIGPYGISGAALASLISVLLALPVWAAGIRSSGVSLTDSLGVVLRRLPSAVTAGVAALGSTLVVTSPLAGFVVGALTGGLVWSGCIWFLDQGLREQLRALLTGLRRADAV